MLLAMMPLGLWAQDNTWERSEEEQQQEETVKVKVNPDQKYLRGAVPEVDGKVVFTKTVQAPGKSAAEVFNIVRSYLKRAIREKNQINSNLLVEDSTKYELGASFEEWLVFKKTALTLDKTRFLYVLEVACKDGSADVSLSRIRYLYEEERNPQHIRAEEWITDKEAVNKKNTRLYPYSGKFRRKTIDRKDFWFNKIETLLK